MRYTRRDPPSALMSHTSGRTTSRGITFLAVGKRGSLTSWTSKRTPNKRLSPMHTDTRVSSFRPTLACVQKLRLDFLCPEYPPKAGHAGRCPYRRAGGGG